MHEWTPTPMKLFSYSAHPPFAGEMVENICKLGDCWLFSWNFNVFSLNGFSCQGGRSFRSTVHWRSNRFRGQFHLPIRIDCVSKPMFFCVTERRKRLITPTFRSFFSPGLRFVWAYKQGTSGGNKFFNPLIFRPIRIREKKWN